MDPNAQYELKDISQLRPNARNPRRISNADFKALQASIQKFGDLSCVVFNRTTGQLVGGHQRVQAIRQLPTPPKIQLLEKYEAPNAQGTVAVGKIWVDNEDYKYREVVWDEGTEKAANIAANRIQGEFDLDLLAQMDYEISQLENGDELLKLSGQDSKELEKLMKSIGVGDDEQPDEIGADPKDSDKLEIRMTREQREIVEEALNHIVSQREIPSEENGSKNGSALYYMARDYLDRLHAAAETPTQPEAPHEPAPAA